MEVEQNIYNLDDLKIKINTTIFICSKRNSGKTVIVQHLLKKLCDENEVSYVILISDTAKFDKE
mgnify:CR=1 FL=1|jgi:type II secretory pathway predicted ATPase ExeA